MKDYTDISVAACYSAGIHINSNHIHVAILDFDKQILSERCEKPHLAAPTLECVLDIAHHLYTEALERIRLTPAHVCGIGISMAGALRGSEVLDQTSQQKWQGQHICAAVQERFQIKNVVVEDDCNSAVIGETFLRPALSDSTIACISLSSNVGSAVTYRGNLVRRSSGFSHSDMGHTLVEPDGMLCDCSSQSCLHTFMAEQALITRAKEYDPSVSFLEDIHVAWRRNVPWARKLIQTACAYARMAINNIACVYDPEIILIGGDSIDAYPDMFQAIFDEPYSHFEPLKDSVTVLPLFRMYHSSIIGVSQQVQEAYLRAQCRTIA